MTPSILQNGYAVLTADGFVLEQSFSLYWCRRFATEQDRAEPTDGPHRIVKLAVVETVVRAEVAA